jgi:hypothetical protein
MSSGVSNLKDNKGPCECPLDDCELWGTLGRADRTGKRHVRGCGCNVCRGRRNKRSGGRKQARAARAIGVPRSTIKPGNEEHFGGFLRVEIKSGAQVGPAWTRYLGAEAQSEASRPFGDNRPFAFIAMPAGTSDGLLICRLSQVDDVVVALAEQLGVIA